MREFFEKTLKEAGETLLALYGKVGVKYSKVDSADVVTEADLKSNEIIIKRIKEKFPDHKIMTEETHGDDYEFESGSEFVWLVDPLDGTRSFATKTPLFGIGVALARNDKLKYAGIYLPKFDEFLFAEAGSGAFFNGERILCGTVTDFNLSFGSGFISWRPNKEQIIKSLLSRALKEPFWMECLNAPTVETSFVATGRRDWLINRGGNIFDFAPPALILKEAGCKVTNFTGKEWDLTDSGEIMAANPVLHEKLVKILNLAGEAPNKDRTT